MIKKSLLAIGWGLIAILCLAVILLQVVIPVGINLGKEQEARNFALILFIIAMLGFFANAGFWFLKLSKEPAPRPEIRPDAVNVANRDGRSLIVIGLLIAGSIQITGGVFVLLLMYGIAVLIFRYAFGVELPNPFL